RVTFVFVSYVERPVASPLVVCTWEQAAGTSREQRVVPDGSVDLIWTGARLELAGPDTRARVVTLASGLRLIGVRLRPGAAGVVLGLPVSELRDVSADAGAVLGVDVVAAVLEALAAGEDPHALLFQFVAERRARTPDPLIVAAVRDLGRPQARVGTVAAGLGVSERNLQRRINEAVGYGPKMLQRVLRFRRLQALGPAPLVELALKAGYADQSHMTAEVTALAGVSPVRFFKDNARPAT
ncbi:MAG TPA: helix-turn-helix domain-containing protein, partial [Solirubrobacteraceae bacterium]